MAVQQVKNAGAEYAQLLGTVNTLIAPKKINIKVFDVNGDNKLSTKELQYALAQLPHMKVNKGFVELNDYNKNGQLVQTTTKIITGDTYNTKTFKYNKNGQMTQELYKGPQGSSTTTFTYHPDGNLQSKTVKAKTGTMIFNYSQDGKLMDITAQKK